MKPILFHSILKSLLRCLKMQLFYDLLTISIVSLVFQARLKMLIAWVETTGPSVDVWIS